MTSEVNSETGELVITVRVKKRDIASLGTRCDVSDAQAVLRREIGAAEAKYNTEIERLHAQDKIDGYIGHFDAIVDEELKETIKHAYAYGLLNDPHKAELYLDKFAEIQESNPLLYGVIKAAVMQGIKDRYL